MPFIYSLHEAILALSGFNAGFNTFLSNAIRINFRDQFLLRTENVCLARGSNQRLPDYLSGAQSNRNFSALSVSLRIRIINNSRGAKSSDKSYLYFCLCSASELRRQIYIPFRHYIPFCLQTSIIYSKTLLHLMRLLVVEPFSNGDCI
jgi:hypothetical protein